MPIYYYVIRHLGRHYGCRQYQDTPIYYYVIKRLDRHRGYHQCQDMPIQYCMIRHLGHRWEYRQYQWIFTTLRSVVGFAFIILLLLAFLSLFLGRINIYLHARQVDAKVGMMVKNLPLTEFKILTKIRSSGILLRPRNHLKNTNLLVSSATSASNRHWGTWHH